jgi:hypothetical protein
MRTTTSIKPPKWFWILSAVALLWNLMGVAAYLTDAYISIEALEKMSQAERLLYESQPAWVTGAYAIAVWGGAVGSIFLLLRNKWARPILYLSLFGIIAQFSYSIFFSNSFEVYGPVGLIMPVLILSIGTALVFFANKATARAWIK